MCCILRISGTDLDVDDLIGNTLMIPDSVWRKGERKFPDSSRNETVHESSGARFVASEGGFSELSRQIREATIFLRENQNDIKAALSFPGVDRAELDFGTEIISPGPVGFTLPPGLLSLAGGIGVSICLSVYPIERD